MKDLLTKLEELADKEESFRDGLVYRSALDRFHSGKKWGLNVAIYEIKKHLKAALN